MKNLVLGISCFIFYSSCSTMTSNASKVNRQFAGVGCDQYMRELPIQKVRREQIILDLSQRYEIEIEKIELIAKRVEEVCKS